MYQRAEDQRRDSWGRALWYACGLSWCAKRAQTCQRAALRPKGRGGLPTIARSTLPARVGHLTGPMALPPPQKPPPLSSLPSEERRCWPTSRAIESRSRWSSRNGCTTTRRGPAVRALSKGRPAYDGSEHAAVHSHVEAHAWSRREPRAAAAGRGEHGGAAREHAASLMG